jgi:hypothetical protein
MTAQLAAWLQNQQTGYAAPPDPRDFPKFKKILRDPDNPSAGYFSVRDTSGDGIDHEAYDRAHVAYNSARPGGNILADDALALYRDKFGAPPAPGAAPTPAPTNLVLAPRTNPTTGAIEAPTGTVDRDAFDKARHDLVSASNGLVSGGGGGGRSPSGGGGPTRSAVVPGGGVPNAVPNASLDGNETITPPPSSGGQGGTFSVRLQLGSEKRSILNQMQQDVSANPTFTPPPPAVALPPSDDDAP